MRVLNNALLLPLQTSDWPVQVGLYILALIVIWIGLRFILRLAMRVFALGCVLILVLGILLAIYSYTN